MNRITVQVSAWHAESLGSRHVSSQIATHHGNIGGAKFTPYFRGAHCRHIVLRGHRSVVRRRNRGQEDRKSSASAGGPAANPWNRYTPPGSGSARPEREEGAKHPKLNLDEKGVILKGYDAVAYFKEGKAVKGDPKYSSTYEGATYYFASADDKDAFDKSPAKYKPQYGGYCANAMTKGKLNDIDPNAFFLYKGKLYVCTGRDSAEHFQSETRCQCQEGGQESGSIYQPPEIPGVYSGG